MTQYLSKFLTWSQKKEIPLTNLARPFRETAAFGKGIWRYWRSGRPEPESNCIVQKLFALTDGRSNDFLFHILESKRRERSLELGWNTVSLVSDAGVSDPTIDAVVQTLKEDGVVVLPRKLKAETVQNLYQMALACELNMTTWDSPRQSVTGAEIELSRVEHGSSHGIDLEKPRASVYAVPRRTLLKNPSLQSLLCDSYLLAIATRYLGVFPVVTKPDMWWDTAIWPEGLRPRPFHTDSGCLRWFKVGVNLTDTTLDTPHFVYVKGSHNPNRATRPLTRRLMSRMCLSDAEVMQVCGDRVVHLTAPAGSITLADTRGLHKGELGRVGHRLVLYLGMEGSAFNSIDHPIPVTNVVGELERAIRARPFGYQFFQRAA